MVGDWSYFFARIAILVPAFMISVSFHEFSHALAAYVLGDDTAKRHGRLTLNPLAHLDPMGSIVLLFSGFGWAKPVPVNPYALERRSRYAFMWVALAGPMSNLLLAVLAAIPFQLGLVSLSSLFSPSSGYLPSFSLVVFEFVTINLVLMVFNLIPLAPLDGEKILYHLVPYSFRTTMDVIRPYGPMILILLIIAGPYIGLNFFGLVLGPAVSALRSLLIGF